jgi:hypothetical protein
LKPTPIGVLAVAAAVALLAAIAPTATAAAAKKVQRAKLADNAKKVGGIRASKKPKPGRLLPLNKEGKIPTSVLPPPFSPDLSGFQLRVNGGCDPGSAMRAVAQDGSVTCEPIPQGDITKITPGTGLTGGGESGDVTVGLALPLSLTSTTSGSLFMVTNNGSGQAIEGRSNSTFATAYFSNSGSGGTIRADTSSTGQGSAVTAYNYGTSRSAVEAELVNSANSSAAIYARTAGSEQAIDAEVNSNTAGDALFARTTSSNPSSFAGIFVGNVSVSGNLAKSSGSFRIDHPLDPANKYLQHSFVESPDMKNIYDGVITTDDRGYATVRLPDYFEALNRDFRYQLTPIRSFSRAIVWQEVENNRFVIRTRAPRVKVSWQVTGIRRDAYARAHRIEVEPMKPKAMRGRYLTPEELGKPKRLKIEEQ